MSVYTIGDLHLSLGTKKPMDIFKGWDNYVERLTENWNRVVGDGDTVVVPGDISWAMHLSETEKDFAYIDRELNGEKIFLKGNHDYWWSTVAKMERFLEEKDFRRIRILNNNAYLVDGIAIVGTRGWINDDGEPLDARVLAREEGRLRASAAAGKKLGGELVAFLHYPPIFNGERNEYILSVIREYGIRRCYYGHIHGEAHKLAFRGEADGTEYHMVSADYLGFMPIKVT
ncbi:MAG: metallophosphoesterase [Bacteroides sp.]|nr:metallophosphoesterase [Eubacterium sp.]MCM1418978.1 metallophosphoesterase [Roseburia sp.]MCM1463128.1 metallophosphoesterase [Bacteroides sp.]